MNEIKMSAKSGSKSYSRNINSLGLGEPGGAVASGSNTMLMFTGDEVQVRMGQPASRPLSLSSSGKSSSQTGSCSTGSSRTLSCSSASSSVSSASSANNALMQTRRADGAVQHVASAGATINKQQLDTAMEVSKPADIGAASKVNANSVSDLASQIVSKNTYGQTYLHFIASRSQSASTLYKVLEHGHHMIGERDIFYRTARDVAVQFNLPNNVQTLDKFIIDQFIAGNTSLLRHLLNQGYSPLIHVSDPDGNDIMLILKLLKLERTIHFLLQMADFQRWRDELHTFIRHGYSAGVSELIKKHKDLVRAKSVHSRTSLHLAVLFGQVEMVNELLEMDPTSALATDNMGRTPLHYTYGLHLADIELIRDRLIACGASLEVRDVKMRTPKYYYIFKREIEEIKRIELELN